MAEDSQDVLENRPYNQGVNRQANQERHPEGPTECFAPGIYHKRKRHDGSKQRGNPFLGDASIVREPGQPERNIGACLMIGACRRDEVPSEAVEMVDGFALTLVIPDKAWPPGALRLIDVDEEQLFKLALR